MTQNQPDDNTKKLISVKDVYKSYGPKMVLDDIDLHVKAGELCTVVGPSGCGKSTLLRLILGQEKPTQGAVYFEENLVDRARPDRGIVYQKYSLFPHLSVLSNVLLGKRFMLGWGTWLRQKKSLEESALQLLRRMRLEAHAHKFPHELSGGMQQRVAIAQALMTRPKVLLMDEPFGALDPGTREDMQLYLLELWEETKMTIFFVTHDLEEAAYLGTRLIVVSQFYEDDRGPDFARGAKIVGDHALERSALSTKVKESSKFVEFVASIRSEGFDPHTKRHVRDFNLNHTDSFRTVSNQEWANQP